MGLASVTTKHSVFRSREEQTEARNRHSQEDVVCVPSGQVPALNDSRELTKMGNLSGLPPTGLHRFDQISQVDLCQVGQPKPVDVPVVHPLAQLHRQTWLSLVDGPVIHPPSQLHRQTWWMYQSYTQ